VSGLEDTHGTIIEWHAGTNTGMIQFFAPAGMNGHYWDGYVNGETDEDSKRDKRDTGLRIMKMRRTRRQPKMHSTT
jgi:hypothetical protein